MVAQSQMPAPGCETRFPPDATEALPHQGHHDHDRHLSMIMMEPTPDMPPMMTIVSAPSPSAATTGINSGITASNAGGQKRRRQWASAGGSRVPRTLRRILARTRQSARGGTSAAIIYQPSLVAAQSPVPHDRYRRWSGGDRSTGRMLPAKPHRFSHGSCRATSWPSFSEMATVASGRFAPAAFPLGQAIEICAPSPAAG